MSLTIEDLQKENDKLRLQIFSLGLNTGSYQHIISTLQNALKIEEDKNLELTNKIIEIDDLVFDMNCGCIREHILEIYEIRKNNACKK